MILHVYTLILSITLTHIVQSQRYIIDNENDFGRYFAFPIDICFQVSIDVKFVKYTCTKSGLSVQKRTFDDPGCTNPTDVQSWGTDDTSPCGGPKFSCDGEDGYQEITYYTAACLNTLTKIPFVVGCFCDSHNTSYQTNCSADSTTVQGTLINYVDDTSCSTTPSINRTTDVSDCYFVAEKPIPIYAKISKCVLAIYAPTSSPTLPSDLVEGQRQLSSLGKTYQYVLGAFIVVLGSITLIAWIDAWYVRINDYFNISAIGQMVFQTIDMMSDCFFTAEVSIQYQASDKFEFEIMLYASMVFIILPNFTALFQLYFYAKKHWLDNDYVRAWLSQYSVFLLAMALMTGSSFSAVALLNSYLFQIELFDMGLTNKELKRFNTRRIWSVVVLENMPQLILQSSYFVVQGGNIFDYPITLSSMVFSVISIIISLMSLTMEKTINKTQRSVTISMDVTGECVERTSSKCRTMSYKLRKLLAPTLGVDFNIIEVVKPMYVQGGLCLDIIIYVNDSKRGATVTDYGKLLLEANETGKLAKIIQEGWKLNDLPNVSGIMYKLTESKADRMNTARKMEKMGADSQFNNQKQAVYNAAAATSISSRDKLPNHDAQPQAGNPPPPKFNSDANSASQAGNPPPPKFNPNAKAANRKKHDSKHDSIASHSALSQQQNNNSVEIEMQSDIIMEMHEEGGDVDEGEGEGGGVVKEGNDENNTTIENLVRMGYENREHNKIAIQKANGDINQAIVYLKEIKEQQKKVQFVGVQSDDKEMPPPPIYNPNARKASRAQRKQSAASSVY